MTKSSWKITTILAVVVLLYLVPRSAHAADYNFCLQAEVQNDDSEFVAPSGATEDYYRSKTVKTYKARGALVRVYSLTGTVISTFYTDTNGCGSVSIASTGYQWLKFEVISASQPGNGNILWMHDGEDSTDFVPGDLYSWISGFYYVQPNGATVYPTVPFYEEFSLFVTASYVLYRVNQGVSDKIVFLGFGHPTTGSTAHHAGYGDDLDMGIAYIHMDPSQLNFKFVVAHEIGHTLAMLYRGVVDTTLDNVPPGDLNYSNGSMSVASCSFTSAYSRLSAEWNTLNMREGFADFYATRVFNNRYHADACFTAFTTAFSAEKWLNCTPDNSGGWIGKACFGPSNPSCTTNPGSVPDGVSSLGDWMRFYWDVFTKLDSACGVEPGFSDMLALYKEARDQVPTRLLVDDETYTAAFTLSNFNTCQAYELLDWGVYNNI